MQIPTNTKPSIHKLSFPFPTWNYKRRWPDWLGKPDIWIATFEWWKPTCWEGLIWCIWCNLWWCRLSWCNRCRLSWCNSCIVTWCNRCMLRCCRRVFLAFDGLWLDCDGLPVQDLLLWPFWLHFLQVTVFPALLNLPPFTMLSYNSAALFFLFFGGLPMGVW